MHDKRIGGKVQSQGKRSARPIQLLARLGPRATEVSHRPPSIVRRRIPTRPGDPFPRSASVTVGDAGMLAAAQAVEHDEISRYGPLIAWAEKLGMDVAVELLNQQEKATDEPLRELAAGDQRRS